MWGRTRAGRPRAPPRPPPTPAPPRPSLQPTRRTPPGRARLRPPTAFPCGPHVRSCDSELLRPMPGPFPLSATLRASRTVPSRPGNLCVSARHPRPPLPPASPLPRGAPVAPTTQQPHVGQGCVWVCVLHSFQTAKPEARGPQRADRPAHSTPSGLETCRVASSHRPTSLGQTWGGPGTRWDKTTETRRGGDPPGASPSLSRGKTHLPSRGCFKTSWSRATVATA